MAVLCFFGSMWVAKEARFPAAQLPNLKGEQDTPEGLLTTWGNSVIYWCQARGQLLCATFSSLCQGLIFITKNDKCVPHTA